MSRFYHLLLEATSRYIWWLILKVLIIETCQKFNHTNRIHIVVVASIQNFRQVQRPAAAMQLTDPQLGGHIGTKHRVNRTKKVCNLTYGHKVQKYVKGGIHISLTGHSIAIFLPKTPQKSHFLPFQP